MMQSINPGILPEPEEIYRDDDENFFVDIRKTKDNAFLAITSDSKHAGNVQVVPASWPAVPAALKPFFREGRPVEVAGKDAWGWLEHHGGCFIMVTSSGNSPNYRIVYAREEMVLRHGRGAEWHDLVPHRSDVQITDVDIFKTHFCVFENVYGFDKAQQMRVIDLTKGVEKAKGEREKDGILHFPQMSYLTPGLNKNYNQDTINFVFSSIVQPSRDCVFNFNSAHTASEMQRMAPLSIYTQRQHENLTPWDYMWPMAMYKEVCTSHDGTQVPLTICQKRDLYVDEITEYDPSANTPRLCMVYVYGSYGEVPALHFQLAPYMWLVRRRWVIAFAHVRGGGEKAGWAEEGKGRKKINSVHDFVACCQFLIEQGYTSADRLVAVGNSAGAVPIAAAANMHGTKLFSFALLRAPFLDIINTMTNPELPLSLAEREDWGDPLNNAEDLDALLEYDPYHNINSNVTYPGMIISTCLDDDRVPPWNAIKYVAKLREVRSMQNVDPLNAQLILRCEHTGGHNHWGNMLPLAEEMAYLIHHFDMPGVHCKTDDLDVMQQMHNYFHTGVMDHDDAQNTFLKWDNWEREKIDFVSKMHTMKHEPNFRALKAQKEAYYWSKTHDDEGYDEALEDSIKNPTKHYWKADMDRPAEGGGPKEDGYAGLGNPSNVFREPPAGVEHREGGADASGAEPLKTREVPPQRKAPKE
jgi:protease II